jgi:hypothetical protein
MPRFDGMGPKGEGPQTGRGLGRCDSAQQTEENALGTMRNQGGGRGNGQGNGGGARRGRRNRFFAEGRAGVQHAAEPSSETSPSNRDVSDLEAKLEVTQEALRQVTQRLDAMQAPSTEESES